MERRAQVVGGVEADVEEKEIEPTTGEVAAVLPRIVGGEGLVLEEVKCHQPPLAVYPRNRDVEQGGLPVEKEQGDEDAPEAELLGEGTPEERAVGAPPETEIEGLADVEFPHGAREEAEDVEPLGAEAHEIGANKILLGVAMAVVAEVVLGENRRGGGAGHPAEPMVEEEVGSAGAEGAPVHVIVLRVGGHHG